MFKAPDYNNILLNLFEHGISSNPIPQKHERPAGWRQAQRRKWNRRTGIFPTR